MLPSLMPIVGVNLPWFFGSYGHDLAPNEHHPEWGFAWDARRAERTLRDAKELGFEAVRLWLCERAEGIVTESGQIASVHPALLANLGAIQELAARIGLLLYPCLLDGNSWKRDGDRITHAIVADPEASARFAERVASPIARAIDPSLALALEVINEPEVMSPECGKKGEPAITWPAIARAIRTIGDAMRAERTLPITAGTMHVFAPRLWGSEAQIDAIDVHMYRADGGLPPAAHIAQHCSDARITRREVPLFAGEAGLPQEGPPTPPIALADSVSNAWTEGYHAVFLWRLERTLITQDDRRARTDAGELVRARIGKERGRAR